VALPRTPQQASAIEALDLPGVTVARRAVDARSLIAFADALVSAGGTMNREAAVLGTPVWSIYEGADLSAGFFFGATTRPTGGTTGFLGTPLDGDRFLATTAVPMDIGPAFLEDRYRHFDNELELFPELAEAVRGARRVGPMRVVQRWHSYFRQSAGPGWVLVGDAGNFKDYSLGQGMSDAMRQAETLAAAIEQGFAKSRIDAHTHEWWRWRDRDAWQMYWTNCLIGEPYLPEAIADAIFEPGSRDPETALRLAGILNKTVPPLRAIPKQTYLTATARTVAALTGGAVRDPRHALRQLGSLASMLRFTTALVAHHPSGPLGSRRYRPSDRGSTSLSRLEGSVA
jgi:hypothetical protein